MSIQRLAIQGMGTADPNGGTVSQTRQPVVIDLGWRAPWMAPTAALRVRPVLVTSSTTNTSSADRFGRALVPATFCMVWRAPRGVSSTVVRTVRVCNCRTPKWCESIKPGKTPPRRIATITVGRASSCRTRSPNPAANSITSAHEYDRISGVCVIGWSAASSNHQGSRSSHERSPVRQYKTSVTRCCDLLADATGPMGTLID